MHEIQITEFLKSNFAIAARSVAFGLFIILLGAKALADGGASANLQPRTARSSATISTQSGSSVRHGEKCV